MALNFAQRFFGAPKTPADIRPRIEKNGDRLVELERKWSVLGPLRKITFSIAFAEQKDAQSFADTIQGSGFELGISRPKFTDSWQVDATREMEPTAANVTFWEEWIEAKAKTWVPSLREGTPARYIRWSYPAVVGPSIKFEHSIWNRSAEAERGRVLFGQTLCRDRIQADRDRWSKSERDGVHRFRLVPSEFLSTARQRRPENPEPMASKFAQWIYSLYADTYGTAKNREDGKAAEEHILAARRRAYASVDDDLLASAFTEWKLVHNGMSMTFDNESSHFTVVDLRVADQALRVLPDLIYRNERTGEIIIVEIKHSRMDIPENLWPNIWGQLWCYAQLPLAQEATKVTVIGEVWADEWRRRQHYGVCLRASVRRNPRSPTYDRFFRALFDIYRGAD